MGKITFGGRIIFSPAAEGNPAHPANLKDG